jgi:hypothetical protein
MIRDWTASEKIDLLSSQAEVFFIRLCMKADDYGSFHGSPKLLKSFLFPLRSGSIRETDITRWTAECEKAGLIFFYNADSKPYVRIIDFGQRLRNKKNRFPEVPSESAASCGESRPEEEVELEVEEKRELQQEEARPPDLRGSNLFRKPIIPTKQQVLESVISAGGDKEMAKSFWDKHEATGWFINGSPIVNFVSLAQKFVSTWKRNESDKNKKEISQQSGAAPLKKISE